MYMQYRTLGKWDVCAGDAIIKSMYGVSGDFSRNEYFYDGTKEYVQGAFFARTKSIWEQAIKRLARARL